jgi:hypothetical protein
MVWVMECVIPCRAGGRVLLVELGRNIISRKRFAGAAFRLETHCQHARHTLHRLILQAALSARSQHGLLGRLRLRRRVTRDPTRDDRLGVGVLIAQARVVADQQALQGRLQVGREIRFHALLLHHYVEGGALDVPGRRQLALQDNLLAIDDQTAEILRVHRSCDAHKG